MKKIIFPILTAIINFTVYAQSQSYNYKNIPIGAGGYVTGVVYNTKEQNLVYTFTDMGGAYRWDDLTKVWIPLFDGIENPNLMPIDGLASDPINTNIVYTASGYNLGATASGSILKSTDKGKSWTSYSLPVPMNGNANVRGLGNRLVIDPNNNAVLYFASRTKGLWKSTNSGQNWARITSLPVYGDTLNGVGITTVIVDKANSKNIYVAAASFDNGKSIYRSTDGGISWKSVAGPVTSGAMKFVIHHMELGSDGNLWCTFGNDYAPFPLTYSKTELRGLVYKLNTSTLVWKNVSPTLAYGVFAGLSIDARNPSHVIVSTNLNYTPDRIYNTNDGGTTWTIIAKPTVAWDGNPLNSTTFDSDGGRSSLPDVEPPVGNAATHWMEAIAINPFDSNRGFFCTGAGVYSIDNMLEPIISNIVCTYRWRGMEQSVALDLTQSVNGALFTALGDIGGMRHFDLDQPLRSKQGFYTNPGSANTAGIDFAGRDPKIVVRVANDLIGYSTDNGLTWSPCAGNPKGNHGKIAVSALGSHIVYGQATNSDYTYYSDDKGATWNASKYSFTLDNGQTWQTANFPTVAAVSSDRVNDKLFISVYNNEIFISTDGGHLFVQKSNIIAGTYKMITSGDPKTVFGQEGEFWAMDKNNVNGVGTPGGSLTRYIWKNNVLTFEKKASTRWSYGWPKFNVGPIGIQSVGFGKAAPGKTYPTVYILGSVYDNNNVNIGYGIYRSDDIGVTWIKINNGEQFFTNPQFCAGDENVYGRVYIATNGRGVLYGEIADSFVDNCNVLVGGTSSIHECAQISNGTYKISSAANLSSSLTSGSTSIVQNITNANINQNWIFTLDANSGYYTIKNAYTSDYLTYAYLEAGSRLNAQSSTPILWRLEQVGITEKGLQKFKIIPANNISLNMYIKTATGINLFLGNRGEGEKQEFVFNYVSSKMARMYDSEEDVNSFYVCYPNPFLVETAIKFNGKFKYSIYTINGNEVENGDGENEIIVGRNLVKGFYIIHIQSSNESIQLKVIKE